MRQRTETNQFGLPVEKARPLPRCTHQQIAVSIEVLAGIATNVVRHVGGGPCHLRPLRLGLTIRDRAGKRVWQGEIASAFGGDFSSGSEQTVHFPIPNDVPHCQRRDPFLARVTVGRYSARRKLSGSEIGC